VVSCSLESAVREALHMCRFCWHCVLLAASSLGGADFYFVHLTVWGVEPVLTHQIPWLESTGVCGVHRNQAVAVAVEKLVGVLLEKEPKAPLLVVWVKQRELLTSNDAVKRAVKKGMLPVFNCLHRTVTTNALCPRWYGL